VLPCYDAQNARENVSSIKPFTFDLLFFAPIAMVAERTSFLENQPNREVARLALTLRETSEQATMNYRGFYVSAKRSIVNEVLEAMASGLDVSTLFSDMLMVSKHKGD